MCPNLHRWREGGRKEGRKGGRRVEGGVCWGEDTMKVNEAFCDLTPLLSSCWCELVFLGCTQVVSCLPVFIGPSLMSLQEDEVMWCLCGSVVKMMTRCVSADLFLQAAASFLTASL